MVCRESLACSKQPSAAPGRLERRGGGSDQQLSGMGATTPAAPQIAGRNKTPASAELTGHLDAGASRIHQLNEAETLAEYIHPALAAAGWGVVEGSRIRREHPITLERLECHGRRGKALMADYVLENRNTKLGFGEATTGRSASAQPGMPSHRPVFMQRLQPAWFTHPAEY